MLFLLTMILAFSFVGAFAEPTWYGATRISAPAGTQIDLRNDARYRIFARDAHGFDISHEITIDGNNWNRAVPATITYSVAGQIREVELVAQTGNQVIQRTLYSFSREAFAATQSSGTTRGINQDRQHLGVFMPAGSTLRVRRVNNHSANWDILMIQGIHNENIRLNADAGLGGTAWATMANNRGRGGIPMVRTPRTEDLDGQEAVIEVEISGNVAPLNYFHIGDVQTTAQFIQRWQTSGHQYALLGSVRSNLIPSTADIPRLTATTGDFSPNGTPNGGGPGFGGNINGLLEWYDELIAYFDRLIGLDINATDPRDKLVPTKFLIAPQRGGPGYAFYGGEFCGMSSGPVGLGELGSYLRRSWVVPHEIGHGYEGFWRNKEIPMVDIKNNILGTMWEMTFLDFTKTGSGLTRNRCWIFDPSDRPAPTLDARVAARRTGNIATTIAEPNRLTDMLYLTMTMSNAGAATAAEAQEAIGELNRLIRRNPDWSFSDLYAKGLSNSRQINIIPFLESYGLFPSEAQKAQVFESGARIAQPLRDLTNADISSHLFPSDGRLLWGSLSLVRPGELDLGNGTAVITINIDDLEKIRGRTLRIKDGEKVVHEAEITSNTISVPSIPAGAYYIELPATSDRLYTTGYNHLIIRNGENTQKSVSYQAVNFSPAASAMKFYLERPDFAWVYRAVINYDALNSRIISQGICAYEDPAQLQWRPNITMEILRNNQRVHFVDHRLLASTAIRHLDVRVGDEIRIHHPNPTNVPGQPFSDATRGLPVYRAVNTLTGERNTTDFTFDGTTLTLVITERGIFKKGTTEARQQEMHTANFELVLNETRRNAGTRWANANAFKDAKAAFLWGANLLSEADRERIMKDFDEPIAPCDCDNKCECPTCICDCKNKTCHDCGECEVCKPTTSIAKPDASTGSATGIRFAQNIVSDRAEISVVLPNNERAVETRIVIYDMTGNVVFVGANPRVCPIVWDLRNSAGRFVANGTYLVIAEARDRNGQIYLYSARLGVKR